MRRRKPKSARSVTYDVGYCRPPVATRFKPGQSGNKKGRPKGRKNMTTYLIEELHRKVKVFEGGRYCWLSVLEVIVRRIISAAMKGDVKLINMLMSLPEPSPRRAGPSDAEMSKMSLKELTEIYRSMIRSPA